MQVKVIRKDTLFSPDPSRVITRFLRAPESRSIEIINTVLAIPEIEVEKTLSQLLRGFSTRHRNITRIFEKNFNNLATLLNQLNIDEKDLSASRKTLLGSYFTTEYSIESVAFYNPSIFEDPDQSGLRPDEKRVIFSFRATGKEQISSIVFRSGILDGNNNLTVEPVGKMLAEADVIKRSIYNKKAFQEKLSGMQEPEEASSAADIFDKLQDNFSYGELMRCLKESKSVSTESVVNQMMWQATSHYEIDFSIDSAISERVFFPIAKTEQRGIEDARFVKFTDESGGTAYYATYTANDGVSIIPKLIRTSDFYHFQVLPMYGEIVRNKGMALFPKKIKGKYAMLSQLDGVSTYISYSDQINIWREAKLILSPKYPWELLQIGNAGSPIETEEGWLVITHAVGPMGKCVISAALFDLDNPEIETGRLKAPLILPNESEREGYVPNVIFSCGSVIHNGDLIIPYAMSDHASTYATVNLIELLAEIKAGVRPSDKPLNGNIDVRAKSTETVAMEVA